MNCVVYDDEAINRYIELFIPYKLGGGQAFFSEENVNAYCKLFLNERGEHK